MLRHKTETQIRSEALRKIEAVLNSMTMKLETARKTEPVDPIARRQLRINKRALIRIEFETLIALSDLDAADELDEERVKTGQGATVLRLAR